MRKCVFLRTSFRIGQIFTVSSSLLFTTGGLTSVEAADLVFGFSNPSFSGAGYSQHVLSLEQLSFNRKQSADEFARSEAQRIQRELDSTTLARFLTNVESRIFATLSKQLVDSLFTEGAATAGVVEIEGNSISFARIGNELRLVVTESDGGITELVIPVGEFGF